VVLRPSLRNLKSTSQHPDVINKYLSAEVDHRRVAGSYPYPPPHSRRLQFLSSIYQLSQLVDEPTRVTEISSTLIDLILTNRAENILSTGVIHLGISDHSLIYAEGKFKLSRSSPTINF
jgi:hypothetical protein